MSTTTLMIIFLLAMAFAIGYGLWLDRHARRRRKMTTRMAGHMTVLAVTVGESLTPAFTQAAIAMDDFARAWNQEVSS